MFPPTPPATSVKLKNDNFTSKFSKEIGKYDRRYVALPKILQQLSVKSLFEEVELRQVPVMGFQSKS